MNKILKRDEFINEVYNPMMEEKEYKELQSINEGLLKTLFGMVKGLFKKDWDSIKCDSPDILNAYREMDEELTGYSIMKMSKKDQCNQIRQALVDFACDWYDMKMNHAKEAESDPKPAKSMKFKDDTLKENLAACEKKIKDVAGDDAQMAKWADTLLTGMKTVINKSILKNIEDEETKKKIEQELNDQKKKQDEENKLMEKWQNEQLKKVQDERKKLISDTGVNADTISDDLLGDKAIQNICGDFDKIRKEEDANKKLDAIKNDKMLGFSGIYSDDDYKNELFKTAYALTDSFYTKLADNKEADKFKQTPGQSVLAMCIAVNSFIKNCVFDVSDYGKQLPLMAKCAILSNGVVSYNLPLNAAALKDMNDKNAGNYFTDTVKEIVSGKLKDANKKTIELPKTFAQNSKTLFNKIKDEAKKLKEQADKDYNTELERKFKKANNK